MARPILWIVIPCYNEEQVLPITAPLFREKLRELTEAGKISENSRVLFVNDGSSDRTWDLIRDMAEKDEHFIGICQSRNRGHQNAVLAGLMEAHGGRLSGRGRNRIRRARQTGQGFFFQAVYSRRVL